FRLGGITPAKDRALVGLYHADLINAVCFMTKIVPVLIANDCKYRAAYRDAGFSCMTGLFPGLFIQADLFGLLYVEGFSALVVLQCRTLKIHALLSGPHGRSI